MSASDPLLAPVKGAERREVGGVQMEIVRAGSGRVKRVIYRPGFRWSKDMKGIVGTDLCMHAHVGFLVSGQIHIEYADGCRLEFSAPQVVAIEPGHDDGWWVPNPRSWWRSTSKARPRAGSGCRKTIATAEQAIREPSRWLEAAAST